ncbi:MAG: biopolymer transporter ExbD [Phycisphaerales bacterium]|nr:biopolymer transporter ExbD [Phycisphaerales bacterium]
MNPLRRRNARAVWDLHYGPNMTPMVDVVMVILIFFMASASVLGPEWFLKSALPRAQAAPMIDPAKQPLRLRIELRKEGASPTVASIDGGEPMPLAAVHARLVDRLATADGAEIIILVAPQNSVPYDEVVRLHELCFRAGIRKVGLIEVK